MKEIYITTGNGNLKKTALKIIVSKNNEIVMVPGYSKECYGENITQNYHTTRHKTFLHRTKYVNGSKLPNNNPSSSYYENKRESLDNLSNYEVIECLTLSPSSVLLSEVFKEYRKINKVEIFLPQENSIIYQVYIILNPVDNPKLYEDLQIYSTINYHCYKKDKYEIVVVIDKMQGFYNTAMANCLGMYINKHSNNGIGNFQRLIF